MADNVYANGRAISCKAGDGKSICAFPDVCFTPPENPATPPGVPIPYPNTGMDDDTSEGSKTVQITGKEVMLKDKSCFKKSTGDEAGCAAKKGIITSVNRGKVYFNSWSMDVKFEGENVVRHLDLTTHNHASTGQTPPWPFAKAMAKSKDPCKTEKANEKKACEDKGFPPKDACAAAGLAKTGMKDNSIPMSDADASKALKSLGVTKGGTRADWAKKMSDSAEANNDAAACIRARRCKLVRYTPNKEKPEACCAAQTGDHIIPKASFKGMSNWNNYSEEAAPVMCAEGQSNTNGIHGLRHANHKAKGKALGLKKGQERSFDAESTLCVQSSREVMNTSNCGEDCLKAQLKEGHKGMGSGPVKHEPSGSSLEKKDISKRIKDQDYSKTSAP